MNVNTAACHFLQNYRWIREKVQVRVNVRDDGVARLLAKDLKQKRRRAGPTILRKAAVLAERPQSVVLELRQPY